MSKANSSIEPCEVIKTGREVDSIVFQLMTHVNDKDDAVKSQITFALYDIGVAQPLLALSSLCAFMQKNPKLDQGHRILLIRQLNQLLETQTARDAIVEAGKSQIPAQNQLASHLIRFCAKEMTALADVVTDISVPCSSCLTLLAGVNCALVVDECLLIFPIAGQSNSPIPHYYIVKTLADVAANHPVEFVQKLKEVMARMTPVIGAIKKSPMKWVFATAYGRFSESMGHYLASCAESGNAATISSASFEIHMASAFDVLFNSWMPDEKEAKVRFACLESLGHMCQLLDRPALEARLPKLIPSYLMMYKKEKIQDHLSISHGLCSTLKEAVKTPTFAALLQPVLMTLHPLISRPVDFAHPTTAKNHNELLRCLEVLARYDLEAVLQFVIGRFQLKERESRLGSLIILRHFVNALEDLLEPEGKKPVIMSSVLTLLTEQDLLLKKTIMQLIVSMANHEYLSLEGGQALIKFILQQCNILIDGEDRDGKLSAAATAAAANGNKDGATPLQIRNAGNHILGVMASKVPSTHKVLWPYLLELIVDPDFNRAAVIIFKVLEHVASVKREEQHPDYLINWEAQVNMPPPQALLCRLMILACEPFRAKGEQGIVMCKGMAALGPIIHPSIGKYFDESAPSLIAHLEQHTADSINLAKWQDTLLKAWRSIVDIVSDNAKWLQDLAHTLGEQFKLLKTDSSLQRCVHRYLGSVLARIESRAVLGTGIDLMLNTVNHASDVERQGCAQGLGLTASVHLDVVLPKLTERLAAPKVEKKSTGFFGFGGSSSAKDVLDDKLASTIALCYGYVTAYANPELIISRLDVHILHNLIPLIPKAKSTLLKIHLIKSIDLIGKAIHSSRLPDAKKNWKLAQRDELMQGLIRFLDDKVTKAEGGKPSLELKLLGVNAAATLANLEPPLPNELRKKLSEAVFPFYGLNAAGDTTAQDKAAGAGAGDQKPSKFVEPKDAADTPESGEAMLEMIMQNMNTLLSSIIQMEPTVPSLVELLKLLEPWSSSARSVERERATASVLIVLKKFVAKAVHEKVPMKDAAIPGLGNFLAEMLARCNDSSITVRQTSAENIQALLYINQVLANPDQPKPCQEIKLITDIRNRLEESNSDDRLVILRDLCSLLTAVVNTNELITSLHGLLAHGVLDSDHSAAQGAALVFKTFIYSKCTEMTVAIRLFVTGLLAALRVLRVGEVAEILLATLRILTRSHFDMVVNQLLETPVPLPREVIDACTGLVETGPSDPSQMPERPIGMEPEWDVKLAEKTLKYFIDVINETPLEKDKPTPRVMTATAAITQMIRVESLKPQIDATYADVLCTLLMRVGTSCGVDKGDSAIDACGAVRAFLESMSEDALLKKLNGETVWPMLEGSSYDDGMTIVTRCFSEVHPEKKRALLQFLSKFYNNQSYAGQRVVATAMLAQFVCHAADDVTFLREVIKFLLPRVADKVEKVRKQALRGLGHLVVVWNAETSAMATSVLSSLTAAAEDADADVAAEAVHSLTRIAGVVSEELIGPMLISICFRLRPAFDRKEDKVRARAFTLFGVLNRFGIASTSMDAGVRENFMDQVHANVPIFIVHSNDAVEEVRTATIEGFRQLAPLLGDEFVSVLADASGEPSNYDELVQKLSPLLNTIHPGRLRGYLENTTQYFTSQSNSMRANSAYLAGVIISTASNEQRRTVSIPALTSGQNNKPAEDTSKQSHTASRCFALIFMFSPCVFLVFFRADSSFGRQSGIRSLSFGEVTQHVPPHISQQPSITLSPLPLPPCCASYLFLPLSGRVCVCDSNRRYFTMC